MNFEKKVYRPVPKMLICKVCKAQVKSNSHMNHHMKNWHPEVKFVPLEVVKSKGNSISEVE